MLLIAIVVGAILTASNGRNFFSVGNVDNILTTTSILGFIAIGQTLVILGGSLDLSVPFVVSLASVVGGGIMAGESGNIVPAVLVTLLLGLVIGLVNGADRHLPQGARLHRHARHRPGHLGLPRQQLQGQPRQRPARLPAARRHPHRPGPDLDPDHARLRAWPSILMLRRTRLGHHLYAVGGNAEVARLSGLRTQSP